MNDPFHYRDYFKELGILDSLFEKSSKIWDVLSEINPYIQGFESTQQSRNYDQIMPNVFVGKNVTIDDTARIVGGAIIGDNSVIGHAAFLRGGVIIGEDVNVGHATEVKHSIILSGTKLAHLNYIGDSLVGGNCNISGGATLANWRFDRQDVTLKNGNERVLTGLEKFGAIVGDGSFLGVSAVLNPGVVLGIGCIVYPLVSVVGTYPPNSKIK